MEYQPTVLLIDDDSDDQEIFCHAMEKANNHVRCVFADDGIQALEKIRRDESFLPDFIFIDMNMPRMNGQQCLAEIKQIDRFRDVPIYMYSTSADPESLEENKRLGATDFIIKPSDINDLVDLLKSIIQKPVFAVLLLLCTYGVTPSLSAQDTISSPIRELKKLSVEELMNIVVTSVSKTPENLSEVASAIQVVTGHDIRRSSAIRLPEALRLAPNLQVFQAGSHDWGVTARGFNGAPISNSSLANKLLVMIDGRTVYTPLFGGVFWDVQNILLEDVDRIEVVSGPGGTLWGSNAVNGVVNILSKEASETQGLFLSGTYGSVLTDHLALRYGGQIDSAFFFRVYGQRFDSEHSLLLDGTSAGDSWDRTTSGFRADFTPTDNQMFTLQGDIYVGNEDDTLSTKVNGQNVIGRWTSVQSEQSHFGIQAYVDRTYRLIGSTGFNDELITFDLDVQKQFPIGLSNLFLVGANYRLQDNIADDAIGTFNPERRTLNYLSGFIQDRIEIVEDRFSITLGSKFMHNEYTGFEIQPSLRAAYTPTQTQTYWAAVSRAVRTPSRFDVDLTILDIADQPDFVSEKVIAYELGYRMRAGSNLSFSVATFFNQYDDLRTFNMTSDTNALFYFGNDMSAISWGVELSSTFLISDWWRIRGGYTYLDKKFTYIAENVFDDTELIEAIDPNHQVLIHSIMDISRSLELDVVTRIVGALPAVPSINAEEVPAYANLNARLGWIYKFFTFSVVGQNLLHPSKIEFGNKKIRRGFYGSIKVRL